MNMESDLILSYLSQNDYVILLDEKGKIYNSKVFQKNRKFFVTFSENV